MLFNWPFPSRSMVVYPLCLSVALILINIMGGAIALPVMDDDAQRDFNTALGTSLLSGYFLLTIRFVHRNLATNLYNILVIKNQNFLFKHYNDEMGQSFKRHVVWCVSIGFVMPIIYMLSEGVMDRVNEPKVLVVAITAIPFWFLMALFLLEVYSSNRLLRKLNGDNDLPPASQIELTRKVLSVGLSSAIIVLSGTALMPIFWINQPVHFFDLLFLLCLMGFVALFLLWPLLSMVLKLNLLADKMFANDEAQITHYIKNISSTELSNLIENKITQQERYASPLTTGHYKKLVACLVPLPISWIIFLLIESALMG